MREKGIKEIREKISANDTAAKAKVRQTKNCISTLLSFPKITDGIIEDSTKTQANACTNTTTSVWTFIHPPIDGENAAMIGMTESTAFCVNNR